MTITYNDLPDDIHHCTSFRDGAWIVWRCPLCPGYERRYNPTTRKMMIRRDGSKARHTGSNDSNQDMSALLMNLSKN